MQTSPLSDITAQLLPVLRQMLKGKYAIALGGSHAKGYADVHSDIDFYMYTEDVVSLEERKQIIGSIADPDHEPYIDEAIDEHIWGGSADFYYRSIKIETTVKSYDKVNRMIEDCIAGNIYVEPTFWTLNGYYNYICLSEANSIRSLDDPHQFIADWKRRLSVYPDKLKVSIMNAFWWKAKFWLDNFHYRSAIRRCDLIYTSGIIQQTVHNMIQVICALNEFYFAGDKKLEQQLRGLKFCPEQLTDELDFLLTVHRDEALLEKQRIILLQIASSVDEYMQLHS